MKKKMMRFLLLGTLLWLSPNVSGQTCNNINGDVETFNYPVPPVVGPPIDKILHVNNDVDNWYVSHGVANLNQTIGPSNCIYMTLSSGAYTEYNFTAGRTYELTYDVITYHMASNHDLNIELSSSLTPALVLNITTIPSSAGNQQISNLGSVGVGVWESVTTTFVATSSFDQLWFYAGNVPGGADLVGAAIDNVCIKEIDPCSFEPEFELTGALDGCTTNFNDITNLTLHPSLQILKTEWTFGDGHSGTGSSTSHLYTEPGTYEICMTVWTTDGSGCCKKEICETITIDEVCSPCNYLMDHPGFEIGIEPSEENPLIASFTLDGMEDGEMEIYGYYWDFGDGTTGIGQSVTHVYEEGVFGTFPVWGTIFYYNPFTGECCSRTAYGDYVIGGGMAPLDNPEEMTHEEETADLFVSSSTLSISPNPSPGVFLIKLTEDQPIESVRVYDLSGNLIYDLINTGESTTYKMDLSSLEKGIYIISINEQNENAQNFGRVILE